MAANDVITTITVRAGAEIKIYATQKVHDALDGFMKKMKFDEAVRLGRVLEAFYVHGKKDGARAAFEAMEDGLEQARKLIPHRLPGRPKKRR